MVYIKPGPYLECQSSSQITASYDELGWRWPMEWCNELQNNSNPKPGKKKKHPFEAEVLLCQRTHQYLWEEKHCREEVFLQGRSKGLWQTP